jgi:hypothetical protein
MPDCKKPELRIDWATHKAAKYAVENWHYSARLPVGRLVKIGAWENGQFIGVVLFGRGANNAIGKDLGLKADQAVELVRVALRAHVSHVSRIVALALRYLAKSNPDLRCVVSYADEEQGHHGGIYQAGNWFYVGRGMGSVEFFHEGRWKHNREVTAGAFGQRRHIDPSKLQRRKTKGKHKYLMPLDAEMRQRIAPLSKPYPKRPKQATDGHPPSSGGATPTRTLQHSEPVNVPA